MQRVDNGFGHGPMATQKFLDCSRLNIIDPEKAVRLGTQEPVHAFVGRYRGCSAAMYCFAFYKNDVGEQLEIEPVGFVETPETLIERRGQEIKQLLAAGFLSATELSTRIQHVDDEALKRLIARAFGSTHKSGVMLTQFRNAKIAPGSSLIAEVVESFGLDYSPD